MFKITHFSVLNSFLVYYKEYTPSVTCYICTSRAVLLAHLLASQFSADLGGSPLCTRTPATIWEGTQPKEMHWWSGQNSQGCPCNKALYMRAAMLRKKSVAWDSSWLSSLWVVLKKNQDVLKFT